MPGGPPGLPESARVGRFHPERLIPCLLIPIFDHGATIRGVVESLASTGLPLLIVNDGSGAFTSKVLDRIRDEFAWVEIHAHASNRGKGAALVTGYRLAQARGFTHVVQLDADAQHDAADVGRFLDQARAHPDALVLGQPIFGADAPRSRLYGRKLSVGLVWLATLSRAVRDPLCGFRCVPLAPVMRLLEQVSMGSRMDFEPELAVRLLWSGGSVVNVPTRVRYDPFGVSHFDVVWDDLRLAWLYTRTTLGMVARLGGLLRRSSMGPTWTASWGSRSRTRDPLHPMATGRLHGDPGELARGPR
jgi:glycosyltransferase involved in cell wall biosynthesis